MTFADVMLIAFLFLITNIHISMSNLEIIETIKKQKDKNK